MAGLAPDKVGAAMAVIATWRAGADVPLTCPQCGAEGLDITDCSARPHAEWYRLSCAACGLDAMLSIPLGSGVPGAG